MSEKMIICSVCNGIGTVERSECTSYHNGDYDYWDEECHRCKGSGRLVENTVITVKTKAYKPKKPRKR